jgi:simple sugar transport system substrate-binding protein
MEAFLKQAPTSRGVFAQNDEWGWAPLRPSSRPGAWQGYQDRTFDATAGVFKAMIAGDVARPSNATRFSPQVYEAALKALNGETLPKWVPSQEGVFYAADAATILPTRKY